MSGFTEFELRVADYLRGLRTNFKGIDAGSWEIASPEVIAAAHKLHSNPKSIQKHELYSPKVSIHMVPNIGYFRASEDPSDKHPMCQIHPVTPAGSNPQMKQR